MERESNTGLFGKWQRRALVVWVCVFTAITFFALAKAFDAVDENHKATKANTVLIHQVSRLTKRVVKAEAKAKQLSASRRKDIAAADLQLCQKLYGQIVTLERQSDALVTVAFYKKLLPNLEVSVIQELVSEGHARAVKVEKQFDPKQCFSLPSQKLLPRPQKHANVNQ